MGKLSLHSHIWWKLQNEITIKGESRKQALVRSTLERSGCSNLAKGRRGEPGAPAIKESDRISR